MTFLCSITGSGVTMAGSLSNSKWRN
jgi:hypothetical protein